MATRSPTHCSLNGIKSATHQDVAVDNRTPDVNAKDVAPPPRRRRAAAARRRPPPPAAARRRPLPPAAAPPPPAAARRRPPPPAAARCRSPHAVPIDTGKVASRYFAHQRISRRLAAIVVLSGAHCSRSIVVRSQFHNHCYHPAQPYWPWLTWEEICAGRI